MTDPHVPGEIGPGGDRVLNQIQELITKARADLPPISLGYLREVVCLDDRIDLQPDPFERHNSVISGYLKRVREAGELIVVKLPENPIEKALWLAHSYVSATLEKTGTHVAFSKDDVYVVWFCYILGGWKALISTTLPDGMYYEVTYNKEKAETYVDAYKKFHNVAIPDTVPLSD